MAGPTKESTSMIRSMALAFTIGLTDVSMKGCGLRENSTEKVNIQAKMVRYAMEYGSKASELSGLRM